VPQRPKSSGSPSSDSSTFRSIYPSTFGINDPLYRSIRDKYPPPKAAFTPATEVAAVVRHSASGSAAYIYLPKQPESPDYGFESRVTDGPSGNWDHVKWDKVLQHVEHWAREVEYVSKTPDFWEELRRPPEILAAVQRGEVSNAPFTPDEQAEISHRLDGIKQLVREKFELTEQQLAAIDQRLDDAKEACGRLGRKDWLMVFYGAVMSTFMTDEIPPHVIQTIVTTVVHGIGHLFGVGGPPPVIGP
jgi:hypothetical protein